MKKTNCKPYWTLFRTFCRNPIISIVLSIGLCHLGSQYLHMPGNDISTFLICLIFVLFVQKKYYTLRYPACGSQAAANHNARKKSGFGMISKMYRLARSPINNMTSSVGNAAGKWFMNTGTQSNDSARRARQEQNQKVWQHYRNVNDAAYQQYQANQAKNYNPNSYDSYKKQNRAKAAWEKANKPYL